MSKKSFFAERPLTDLRSLNVRKITRPQGLVEIIDSLNPETETLELRFRLTPGRFFAHSEDSAQASRKCLKHGDYIALSHPKTKEECFQSPLIPLAIRARDFAHLQEMREEEINYVGYSVRPTWGDRTRRVMPFVFLPQGVKLFGYAETQAGGIVVHPYKDAARVKKEGANIILEVPSRTKKQPRYKFRISHVPIVRNQQNLATVLLLKPGIVQDEATQEPIRGRPAHNVFNMRYTYETDQEGSDVITYYPQDVAGYIAIYKKEWVENKNMTPLDMNPFALPSQHQATFFTKLDNVIVYDPTLSSKHQLRKLHLAEKSILLARAIGKFGHDDFCFWDWERDGAQKDYDWTGNR